MSTRNMALALTAVAAIVAGLFSWGMGEGGLDFGHILALFMLSEVIEIRLRVEKMQKKSDQLTATPTKG